MYWMPCERRSGTAGSSSPSSIPAILSSSGGMLMTPLATSFSPRTTDVPMKLCEETTRL